MKTIFASILLTLSLSAYTLPLVPPALDATIDDLNISGYGVMIRMMTTHQCSSMEEAASGYYMSIDSFEWISEDQFVFDWSVLNSKRGLATMTVDGQGYPLELECGTIED